VTEAGDGPTVDATRAGGARRSGTRLPNVSSVAVALALGLGLASVAANVGIRRSARPYLHHHAEEVPLGSGVAIVPGASVHRDGTPSPQLEERLRAALALLLQGRVSAILVSGAHRGAYDEAGPMRRWLLQRGAGSSAVREDHSGFRTLDTMERAVHVFAVERAVICTQAFHLPRAVFLARHARIETLGLAADATPRTTGAGDWVREWFANVMAVGDVFVWHRGAREPGAPREGSPR